MTEIEAMRLCPRQRIYHAATGEEWIVNGWPRTYFGLRISVRRGSWFRYLTNDNRDQWELRPDTSRPIPGGPQELVARQSNDWSGYEIRNPSLIRPVVGFLHEVDGLIEEGQPVYVARSSDDKLRVLGTDIGVVLEQFKQAHFNPQNEGEQPCDRPENEGLTG